MNTSSGSDYGKGIVAGFAATVVLSVIMLMKEAMGLMPELNMIKMLSGMLNGPPAVGWVVHFAIGTLIWGIAFAWLDPYLPGSQWFRGVIFACGAWLIMMVVLMPMAGAGLFGLNLGVMAPVATFVLHCVYGAVLGSVYGALLGRDAPGPGAISRTAA